MRPTEYEMNCFMKFKNDPYGFLSEITVLRCMNVLLKKKTRKLRAEIFYLDAIEIQLMI